MGSSDRSRLVIGLALIAIVVVVMVALLWGTGAALLAGV